MDPGQRIGRYELERPLGAGGLGEVWSARLSGPMGFSRRVAIKLIRLDRADDPARAAQMGRLLVNEARLCGLLHHANVVPVTDFGEQEGTFFAVQEFVEGVNLREFAARLREAGSALPPAAALEVGRQVAAGLAHAHGLRGSDGVAFGVVHRDIKPENLMVTADGLVRVLDFGIARSQTNLERTATGHDVLRGTLAYMAPEQIDADRPIDGRTDLHALGLVLFELLVGRRLYLQDAALPLIHEILNRDFSDDLEEAAAICPEARPLLGGLLARRAADRPACAAEVEAECTRLMEGRPGAAALRAAVASVWRDADAMPAVSSEGGGDGSRRADRAGLQLAHTVDSPGPVGVLAPTAVAPTPPPTTAKPARRAARWLAVAAVVLIGLVAALVSRRGEAPSEAAPGRHDLVLLSVTMPGEDAPAARWALLHHLDPVAARLDPLVGGGLTIPNAVHLDGRVGPGGEVEWLAIRRSDRAAVDPRALAAASVPAAPSLDWTGGISASFGRVPLDPDVFYSAVVNLASADGGALPPVPTYDEEAGGFFAKELWFCLPAAVREGEWRFRAEIEWTVAASTWTLKSLRAIRPEEFATTEGDWDEGMDELQGMEACLAARPWPPAPPELNGRRVVTTLLVGGLGGAAPLRRPDVPGWGDDLPVGPSRLAFQAADLQLRYAAAPSDQVIAARDAFARALAQLEVCEAGVLGAAGVRTWRLRSRVHLGPDGAQATTTAAGRPGVTWRDLQPEDRPRIDAVRSCVDERLLEVAWPSVDRAIVLDAVGVYGPPAREVGPPGSMSAEEATVALTMAVQPRLSAVSDCLLTLAVARGERSIQDPSPYLEVSPSGVIDYAAFDWVGVEVTDAALGCASALTEGLTLPATGYAVVINPGAVARPEPSAAAAEGEPATQPSLTAPMRSASGPIKRCWEAAAPTATKSPRAKVVASFTLSPGGSLHGLRLEAEGAGDLPRLTDCVASALLDVEFGPLGQDGVEVEGYPWVFSMD